MKSANIPLSLLLAFVASASVRAAPPADDRAAAAPMVYSGAYRVSFNIQLASQSPAGAVVACRARVEPSASLTASGAVFEGRALARGQSGNCAVELPLSWSADRGQPVSIAWEVVTKREDEPAELRQSQMAVPMPTAGTMAQLNLTVAF